jgi:hypothetical protein
MTTAPVNEQPGTLADELDVALTSLERALQHASQATSAIRGLVPQIAALAGVVADMEATMTRARQHLASSADVPARISESLREIRPLGATAASVVDRFAPEPQIEAQPELPAIEEEPQDEGEAQVEPAEGARCLLLEVTCQDGSLDLKSVDSSVGEHEAVVDVALLDYDGRRASLKVWLREDADPVAVQSGLIESLQRHFGDDRNVEITIDITDEMAA